MVSKVQIVKKEWIGGGFKEGCFCSFLSWEKRR